MSGDYLMTSQFSLSISMKGKKYSLWMPLLYKSSGFLFEVACVKLDYHKDYA